MLDFGLCAGEIGKIISGFVSHTLVHGPERRQIAGKRAPSTEDGVHFRYSRAPRPFAQYSVCTSAPET